MRIDPSGDAGLVRHAVAASLGAQYQDSGSGTKLIQELAKQRRLAGNPLSRQDVEAAGEAAKGIIQHVAIHEAINQIARNSSIRPEVIADRFLSEEADQINLRKAIHSGVALVKQRMIDSAQRPTDILDNYNNAKQQFRDIEVHSGGATKPLDEFIDFEMKPAFATLQQAKGSASTNATPVATEARAAAVKKVIDLQISLINAINDNRLSETDAMNVSVKVKQSLGIDPTARKPSVALEVYDEASAAVRAHQRDAVMATYRELSAPKPRAEPAIQTLTMH